MRDRSLVEAKQPTFSDAHAHTRTQGLISPAWLQAHLDDPDLAILDVRGEVAKGQVQPDGSQVGVCVCMYLHARLGGGRTPWLRPSMPP